VVTGFSLVVVIGDTAGTMPNNGVVVTGAVIVVEFSLVVVVVVIGGTTGTMPNNGVVVTGAVMVVEFSFVVTGADVIVVIPNDGKAVLKALVVTAGGIDKTFSLVVVGII